MLAWCIDPVASIQCYDNSRLTFAGHETEMAVVHTSDPIHQKTDTFYFEVKIGGDSNLITIGLSTSNVATEIPGWSDNTIAISGLDGSIYMGQDNRISSSNTPFTKGDIIGCHTMHIKGDGGNVNVCQFRKNGEIVGVRYLEWDNLYPAVALGTSAEVIANLGGAKFRYNQGIIIDLFICIGNALK